VFIGGSKICKGVTNMWRGHPQVEKMLIPTVKALNKKICSNNIKAFNMYRCDGLRVLIEDFELHPCPPLNMFYIPTINTYPSATTCFH
jgi:hypothetical protein